MPPESANINHNIQIFSGKLPKNLEEKFRVKYFVEYILDHLQSSWEQ